MSTSISLIFVLDLLLTRVTFFYEMSVFTPVDNSLYDHFSRHAPLSGSAINSINPNQTKLSSQMKTVVVFQYTVLLKKFGFSSL